MPGAMALSGALADGPVAPGLPRPAVPAVWHGGAACVTCAAAGRSSSRRRTASSASSVAWRAAAAADLRDAVLAGALVKAATVPLERVTVPVLSCSKAAQHGVWATARDVARLEGFRGFFKGGALDLLRGAAARGMTVGLADSCQRALGVSDPVAGALAGAGQTLLLYPLEVVQTARRAAIGPAPAAGAGLAPQPAATTEEPAALDVLRTMARRGGLRGLYPALVPSLAGFSGFYALQFGVRRPIQEATGSPFAAGFLGSVLACALCNWNNVVRLTMQRRAVEGAPQRGWAATLAEEYQAGGLGRFYAGFGVKVVQTGSTMGLILAVYESLRAGRS